jgi:hypothetical protein
MQAIRAVNQLAEHTELYQPESSKAIHPESNLPFRISPNPLTLPVKFREELADFGRAIVHYYHACRALLALLPDDHLWKRRMNHHKPEELVRLATQESHAHLFVRPDFILSEGDSAVVEVETGPFGLGLSQFLADAFRHMDVAMLTDSSPLLDEIVAGTIGRSEKHLCIAHTKHSQKYAGQFRYLAKLLMERGIHASAIPIDALEENHGSLHVSGEEVHAVYRGFHLHEFCTNRCVQHLMSVCPGKFHPAIRPDLEEKALLALLSEPEFTTFFTMHLREDLPVLERIIPRTWVLDQKGVPPTFTRAIGTWQDLAKLPRRERSFVLKTSGFSPKSAWSRGVTFLDRLSREKCHDVLTEALASTDDLFVIQECRRGNHMEQPYFDFETSKMETARGKVRFTPFFSTRDGRLLSAKATLCEGTDIIHASVDSINVPVV